MTFQKLMQEDRRLVLLRSLNDMGYEANESILDNCLEVYGHRCSRDVVKSELAWLAEQSLISVRDVSGLLVASITGRGIDVATGQATVPGVKRPRPQ
ncbi:TPA: ArsR family transcriptional regulator [Salmonella enterica subsp. enterica serovar Lehrte]|nr:ArsR family transcriptional regulator [Salmonella enterica subsp. enterica serovar Essen]HCM2492369.1 ArsR family transcriptional regulator [Salmonella enterica subsp. enterica serovar Lehrte]HCM2495642.1 ArsR family transcriptional regulator [Salmonella enterica subsp. enterica serovar Lehrte]